MSICYWQEWVSPLRNSSNQFWIARVCTDHIAANDRTADSTGKNFEGNGCVITEILSQHLVALVRKMTMNLSQDKQRKTTLNLSQDNQRQKDPSEPFQLSALLLYWPVLKFQYLRGVCIRNCNTVSHNFWMSFWYGFRYVNNSLFRLSFADVNVCDKNRSTVP